jgi:phage terminase large subunit
MTSDRERVIADVAGMLAPQTENVLASVGVPMSEPQERFQGLVEGQLHRYVGYGGSRGGAKSWNLRRAVLRRRLTYGGSRGLILRRTYEELYGNHIMPLLKVLPQDSYTYNDSKHRMTFKNGSVQEFGFCANDRDVLRYHGQEYDDIAIDEAQQWQERWFDELTGSCRTTRTDLRPLMLSSFMPGGIGHGWVKRRWVDRDFRDNEAPNEYVFVRARVYDNPKLMEADPDYLKTLEALPEDLRRAWLDGDFDVFAGQYFRELRKEVHGFTGEPPYGWTFRTLDYGESSPSAVYWCRVDNEGVVWVYRELYGAEMTYAVLADKINAMSVDPLGRPEGIRYTVFPPDIFAKSKGTGIVGAEVLRTRGLYGILADDNRVEGWRQMRAMLQHPPRLRVSLDTCPHFWRTVPTLIHDDKNGEDLDTDGEDHAADAIRYGLMSRPTASLVPLDAQGEETRPEHEDEPVSTRAGVWY